MRPQKVLDDQILAGLTKIFRSKGYEGASLQELAEATGLKKASLYHRFPNGKQEMAAAVLEYIDKWVNENIFGALLDEEKAPQARLKKGLDQIRVLYDNGSEICIFRALSMEAGLALFEKQVNGGMKQWIDTFKKTGMALGLSAANAEKEALKTLIEIQGSLIVTRILNDLKIFDNTIKNIESRYLKK